MYLYQLMLSKEWQQQEQNKLLARQSNQYTTTTFQPNPKRIKYFYDDGYNDIVKRLVREPNSCKNFYAVLQQVGLPYQSYYDKVPEQVASVLKTALYHEQVILVELPTLSGFYHASIQDKLAQAIVPLTQQEPVYQSDDSWLVVDLVNHQPILIDIRDAADSNKSVAAVDTSSDEIHLERANSMSSAQVLPKVHILLGGQQGDYNLAQRGEKPLRVKKLAQQWVDELSALLQAGNSPFSIAQDEALASLINYAYSPARYPNINMLNEGDYFRPDQYIGALFYQLLLTLNSTDFIIAQQRIGDLLTDEGEGAIPDRQQLQQARKALNNIRHSDDAEGIGYVISSALNNLRHSVGYDSKNATYTSDSLAKTAREYLQQPLINDGTGQDNDYETKLKVQIAHYTKTDELTDIENLYFNAIKLIKLLREPGMIRHVMTRRKYKLKAIKLEFRHISTHYNDVEAYLLTARSKITDIGWHSALYLDIKDQPVLLFDPNGAFKRNRRGNAEYLYDEYDTSFTLEEFVKYHNDDGDDVNQRQITLTKEQAKIIEKNIIEGSFGDSFYCARAVSEVLKQYGVDETYILPGSLEEAVKKIEKSKYNAKK